MRIEHRAKVCLKRLNGDVHVIETMGNRMSTIGIHPSRLGDAGVELPHSAQYFLRFVRTDEVLEGLPVYREVEPDRSKPDPYGSR